jgi:hypothetical protein
MELTIKIIPINIPIIKYNTWITHPIIA